MKRIATKTCACMCALILATSGSAMVGCSGNSSGNDGAQQGATSQEAGYTFTDDLGNQVTVSQGGKGRRFLFSQRGVHHRPRP